jgi:hypothetical protein
MGFVMGTATPSLAADLLDQEPANDDRTTTPTQIVRQTSLVVAAGPFELSDSPACADEPSTCDRDWVRLVGLRTDDFVMITTTTRPDLSPVEPDTLVGIFGPDGSLLAEDEDFEVPSQLGFRVPSDGDYTFVVSGTSDPEFIGDHAETGRYELAVAILPESGAGETLVDKEPFNDGTTIVTTNSVDRGEGRQVFAGPFTLMSTQLCRAETLPCDVDFMRITGALAGDRMTITTYPLEPTEESPGPDTLAGVFDASGELIDLESDFSVGSRFDFDVTQDATHFVGITGSLDDVFEGWHLETGPYALVISVFPVPSPGAGSSAGAALLAIAAIRAVRREAGRGAARGRRRSR